MVRLGYQSRRGGRECSVKGLRTKRSRKDRTARSVGDATVRRKRLWVENNVQIWPLGHPQHASVTEEDIFVTRLPVTLCLVIKY